MLASSSKRMFSSRIALVVLHYVPCTRPARTNANACPRCIKSSRKFHSLQLDQRLLFSIVQRPHAHKLHGPYQSKVPTGRTFHGSSGSQVWLRWAAIEHLVDF